MNVSAQHSQFLSDWALRHLLRRCEIRTPRWLPCEHGLAILDASQASTMRSSWHSRLCLDPRSRTLRHYWKLILSWSQPTLPYPQGRGACAPGGHYRKTLLFRWQWPSSAFLWRLLEDRDSLFAVALPLCSVSLEGTCTILHSTLLVTLSSCLRSIASCWQVPFYLLILIALQFVT